MKKLRTFAAVLLTVIITVSSFAISVVANETTSYPYNDIDELNPEDFAEANDALRQIGRAAQMERSARTLSVVHYYQNGQSWSNDKMQNAGVTIGSQGCCLTSFAMIERFLGGADDPRAVNTKMGNYACDIKNGFSYTEAAKKYNFTIINYDRDERIWNE